MLSSWKAFDQFTSKNYCKKTTQTRQTMCNMWSAPVQRWAAVNKLNWQQPGNKQITENMKLLNQGGAPLMGENNSCGYFDTCWSKKSESFSLTLLTLIILAAVKLASQKQFVYSFSWKQTSQLCTALLEATRESCFQLLSGSVLGFFP